MSSRCIKQGVRTYQKRERSRQESLCYFLWFRDTWILYGLIPSRFFHSLSLSITFSSFESQASVHKFMAILRTQDAVLFWFDSLPCKHTHWLHPPSSFIQTLGTKNERMRVTRVRVDKREILFLFVRKFMATNSLSSLPGLTSILIEHISSLVPASAASGDHVGRFQSIWYQLMYLFWW